MFKFQSYKRDKLPKIQVFPTLQRSEMLVAHFNKHHSTIPAELNIELKGGGGVTAKTNQLIIKNLLLLQHSIPTELWGLMGWFDYQYSTPLEFFSWSVSFEFRTT